MKLYPPVLFPVASLAIALLFLTAVPALRSAETAPPPAPPKKVREPAVAGLFYPKDPTELARTIDRCLAAANPAPFPGVLKAVICPHAGYEFSGPVAAFAYKLLHEHSFDTVVLLAPSHYARLEWASVSGADVFRTPLGDVPISKKAQRLAALRPFALDAPCVVERPEWWRQSSRPPPAREEENADTWEHADEVEVPFLQKTLGQFDLVPVVFGNPDEGRAARDLAQVVDDRTLIVVSSDLSHYDTYSNAQKRDRRCIDAICALEANHIERDDACGAVPIRTLIHLAKAKGWQAQLLDYRNSGDTTGDKSHGVVGYAAIAFFAPAPVAEEFNADDRKLLLGLARRALREAVTTGKLPEVSAEELSAKFTADKACFVTLTKHGELRGCIGYLEAQGPLYRAILDNARNAALHDPRFEPVTERELDRLEIEISVLTAPQPLAFNSPDDLLRKLQPRRDGVVLQMRGHGATYLPQVWEQIPDKTEFLDNLAIKAGCEPKEWRKPGVRVSIYHVEAFKEADFAQR